MGAKNTRQLLLSPQTVLAAGVTLPAAVTYEIAKLDSSLAFGNGSGAATGEIAKILYRIFDATTTGDQVIDLAAWTDPAGNASQAFTNIRRITIFNDGTAAAHVITVGNAATNTFVGPFGAAAHTMTVQAGCVTVIGEKYYGAGHAVGGATKSLLLAFGAQTFAARVLIEGY